ncbi:glycine betaine/L-proline ABC transporter substrate-binding protein ProX [Pararhizobium mangrovi]|uniref:Glycine betaine/L-proline ABC transporter substrate-binding protein ProX n=1 Tax=Pararhizobium mangrovi TaxID=2590452 RepID=A0A506TZU3_9HYPH|nr:glycine betaine/L-proline ABC transporter substrate-binding protein ProX [Pararhizobium mangrovi]TPW26718.1 glycine betaine/L-proline ABC transporter substrate-binding protein ProX [Pararhizobium mangrovi]
MKKTLRSLILGACALAFAMPVGSALAQSNDKPGEGKSIKMARATWDTGWWQAEIYRQLFEKLGYDVGDPLTLSNPPFYQAVGQGDVDLWVNGWFPSHNTYEKFFSPGAKRVGYVAKGGALQGFLVDKKSAEKYHIKYLSDITKPEVQKAFDSNGDGKADLIACPPGWGCEKDIAHMMDAYKLHGQINLVKAGYSASMADAIARYQNDQPILFYTWTPNWTVGLLKPGRDVQWLQVKKVDLPKEEMSLADAATVKDVTGCPSDPCVLGFPANDIRPVANVKFLDANPSVNTLLEEVQIPLGDIFKQNAKMNDGADGPKDLKKQATDWIDAHQDEVNGWLDDARKAASKS